MSIQRLETYNKGAFDSGACAVQGEIGLPCCHAEAHFDPDTRLINAAQAADGARGMIAQAVIYLAHIEGDQAAVRYLISVGHALAEEAETNTLTPSTSRSKETP